MQPLLIENDIRDGAERRFRLQVYRVSEEQVAVKGLTTTTYHARCNGLMEWFNGSMDFEEHAAKVVLRVTKKMEPVPFRSAFRLPGDTAEESGLVEGRCIS